MIDGESQTWAYISVGSNIDPEESITAALALLGRQIPVTRVSTFYRTKAIGDSGDSAQPDFLNGVWEVRTEREPRWIKYDVLLPIETACGRRRTADKFAPRTIDLDLVLYGDAEINESDMTIPHCDLIRPFVCGPLLELVQGLGDTAHRARLLRLLSKFDVAPVTEAEAPPLPGEPQTEFTRILRESLKP